MSNTFTFHRSRMVIEGDDAISFCNRMLSNNLSELGNYAVLLEPEGPIISGGYWQIRQDSSVEVLCLPSVARLLKDGLEKYIFFRDDVRISDPVWVEITSADDPLGTLYDCGRIQKIVGFQECPVEPKTIVLDPNPIERRTRGVPLLGLEAQPGDLVLDWRMGYFLSLKGCYVGQEVVERMWSRARRAKIAPLVHGTHSDVTQWSEKFNVDISTAHHHNGESWVLVLLKKSSPALEDPVCKTEPIWPDGPDSLALDYDSWCSQTN